MKLETTIITSPDSGLSLDRDIRLIKLSLIYSDKITLISPKASMIMAMMQMSTLNELQQFQMIKEIAPIIDPTFQIDQIDEVIHRANKIKNQKRKSKEELIALGMYRSILNDMNKSFSDIGDKFYSESKFEQLIPLIENDKIEFKHFDIEKDNDQIQQFIQDEIIEALNKSSIKYPVFDELISKIAYYHSLDKEIISSKQNILEIECGKEVILELPNIDSFSISDIIRLKGELDNELNNFKRAILNYSNNISSNPFSKESIIEIKKQYEYYIKPELNKLRSQIKKNRFIKYIIDDVLKNQSKYISHSMIGIGLCTIFDFEQLLVVSGVLSESIYNSYKAKKNKVKELKEHPLFFLNEINQLK